MTSIDHFHTSQSLSSSVSQICMYEFDINIRVSVKVVRHRPRGCMKQHPLWVMTNRCPSTHGELLLFRNRPSVSHYDNVFAQGQNTVSFPVLLSPVLSPGILLDLTFPGLSSRSPWLFSFTRAFSFSLSLFFPFSLFFFGFFRDLLLDEGLASWRLAGIMRAGDDVLCVGSTAELENTGGGWLSLSDEAVSWESQSLPLWLESLLTSDNASKGRGMSSTGSCWELDAVPVSDTETATPAWAPPASPLPLEKLSLSLTGCVTVLLARCDILGFLLARGSMKSIAGRFCYGGKENEELSGRISNVM